MPCLQQGQLYKSELVQMLFYLFAIDVSVAVIPNGWMGTAAKSRGVQYAAFCRFIAIVSQMFRPKCLASFGSLMSLFI